MNSMKYIDDESISKIINFDHYDPFSVLGFHEGSVRAFIPSALSVSLLKTGSGLEEPMERIHPDGFFIYPGKFHAGA